MIAPSVSTGKEYVVLIFGAKWCGACKIYDPIWRDVKNKDLLDKYDVYYIDTDEHFDYSKAWKVDSLPTTIIVKRTPKVRELSKRIGVIHRSEFRKLLITMLELSAYISIK